MSYDPLNHFVVSVVVSVTENLSSAAWCFTQTARAVSGFSIVRSLSDIRTSCIILNSINRDIWRSYRYRLFLGGPL